MIHEGLSVFRFDTRYQKLLQIYGSPTLHVAFGKRTLKVDFNPDWEGDFHEVSVIHFNGDQGFSIEIQHGWACANAGDGQKRMRRCRVGPL